uniref:J domain-containing protein n=1 Tax=Eutreptiella gymnastica TaxID=73025 RepID=A0A7S4G7I8_9EUGL
MYHPDVNTGDDRIFKLLNHAYQQILDIRAGRSVAEDFDDSLETWMESVKERNAAKRRQTANVRKMEYFQLRDWYVFSEGFRTEERDVLFVRWLRLWATLNIFEVASAVRVGRFGIYVERLRESFTAGMLQAEDWASQNWEAMQEARQNMSEEDVSAVTQRFDAQFGVDKMLREAYDLFEKLRREESGIDDEDFDEFHMYYEGDSARKTPESPYPQLEFEVDVD